MELVTIQVQEVRHVRRGVEDPPALRLARTDSHRRVQLPVDQARILLLHDWAVGGWPRHVRDALHTAPVGIELCRVEHQEPLGEAGDAGQSVEVTLDDDWTRQPREDLIGYSAVQMRVIPIEASRVV